MNIKGKVTKGKEIGRKLGFPTANIANISKIKPGIYAGQVKIGEKKMLAALYVSEKSEEILEAHIIDFSEDIYGKEIEVEVLEKIRGDQNISDLDELKKLISSDIQKIKNV